jgi:hypothetical protein
MLHFELCRLECNGNAPSRTLLASKATPRLKRHAFAAILPLSGVGGRGISNAAIVCALPQTDDGMLRT